MIDALNPNALEGIHTSRAVHLVPPPLPPREVAGMGEEVRRAGSVVAVALGGGVQVTGCGVQGSGFRIRGSGIRVQGLELRVQGSQELACN